MAQVPAPLKSISMYLKLANEHENRDPVVAYYCRLYAVQKGMEIDRRTPECKQFLMQLMDTLDTCKKALAGNDNITNETLGQVYLEEYSMRLFMLADGKDRAGDFSQSTIKSFYTAGVLMDVLSVFGETQSELEKCRKYAKWKALYINQCLKNGETPHRGPLNEEGAMEAPDLSQWTISRQDAGPTQPSNSSQMFPPNANLMPSSSFPGYPSSAPGNVNNYQPPPIATSSSPSTNWESQETPVEGNSSGVHLRPEDFTLAEKHCKYASSALQYQDAKTAIDFLQKALKLLTTGSDK